MERTLTKSQQRYISILQLQNLFSHETGDGSTMQWKNRIQASKDPYEFKFNKIEMNL